MLKKLAISLESCVSQSQGNIVSDMDGETVMMSISNGKYYNLGKIGGKVWGLMSQETTVSQIVLTLQAQFNIEQKECEEQVISFLNQMLKENLVQVKSN
ncbi:lasso peptide biosynthesis PqqD family chaperone [Niallia sp. 01092]|uniref:lasso peptide biosynthesis PqqD family chaperone n=1 Tax=unclassified Niallia TaxID=2837522 RepID=UPI003FD27B31